MRNVLDMCVPSPSGPAENVGQPGTTVAEMGDWCRIATVGQYLYLTVSVHNLCGDRQRPLVEQ